jgi:hypothetical protein
VAFPARGRETPRQGIRRGPADPRQRDHSLAPARARPRESRPAHKHSNTDGQRPAPQYGGQAPAQATPGPPAGRWSLPVHRLAGEPGVHR